VKKTQELPTQSSQQQGNLREMLPWRQAKGGPGARQGLCGYAKPYLFFVIPEQEGASIRAEISHLQAIWSISSRTRTMTGDVDTPG